MDIYNILSNANLTKIDTSKPIGCFFRFRGKFFEITRPADLKTVVTIIPKHVSKR